VKSRLNSKRVYVLVCLEFSALQILLTSQCSSAVLNEVHLFS
jgi:hypothetical protein